MTDLDKGHLASARGIFGVFFIVLGAGVILDGDWWWPGGSLASIGAWLLASARPRFGALS